ncbi:Chitin binding domain [Trinorchestia longiramus]|nr:Chitin binding domain [Trinorchestia longiramus]
MGTRTFITAILIVAAAVCCSGARQRLGKLTRQARQVGAFSSAVNQAVVTNTISNQNPQPQQPQSLSVPLAVPQAQQYQQQSFQSNQQSYQPAPQPLQQIQQQQYQPIQPQPNQVAPQQYQPGAPQQIQPPQQQYKPVVPQPQTSYPQPQTSPFDSNAVINQVSQTAPAYSQFMSVKTTRTLVDKLPSNATRIRPNLVDGFSCQGKMYGYYADPLNDCQVFHVCYPLKDVFDNHPEVPDITYDFSFICNDFLAFDQSSLTCGWATEIVPCEHAEELYNVVNSRFFEIPKETPQGGAVAGASGGYVVPSPIPAGSGGNVP